MRASTFRSERSRWRMVSAALLPIALTGALVGAPLVAQAAPTPISGPDAGGTQVTLDQLSPLTFTQISLGNSHSLAIGDDGETYAWGRNNQGQLGNNAAPTNSPIPVAVTLPAGVTAFTNISAGNEHSLAIGDDGTTYAWGENFYGQLGNNAAPTSSPIPVAVTLPVGVTAFTNISAGYSHSLAIGDDGQTYAWGRNFSGQLGNNAAPTNSPIPVAVTLPVGVTAFTSISAGGSHSLAIGDDGQAYAWGINITGELGNNAAPTSSSIPVAVTLPVGVTAFTSVSAGGGHSVAIGDDGQTYAWGTNSSGQLGDNTAPTSSPIPVAVTLPAGVTAFTSVATGSNHSVAIGDDGQAYAWGSNLNGQLGNNAAPTDSSIPVAVTLPAGVTTFSGISSGGRHSMAIGDDGKNYAWGSNLWGQSGNNAAGLSPIPVEVSTAATVTSVTFDGVAGTGLSYDGVLDRWTVVTPPHAVGPVDVVVSYERFGVAQPPIVVAGGFTYTAALAVTGVDASGLLIVALLALGAGMLLLLLKRRYVVRG